MEIELLRKWEPQLRLYARKVWHPERAGLGRDDVLQELRLAVILACRLASPDLPTDAYLRKVLANTATSIVRLTCAQKRAVTNEDGFLEGAGEFTEGCIEHPTLDPEQALHVMEAERHLQTFVFRLRQGLSPAQFALLHLRFAHEWTPEAIATNLGYGTDVGTKTAAHRVSQALQRAKAQAVAFLATIGVSAYEDTEVGDAFSIERDTYN